MFLSPSSEIMALMQCCTLPANGVGGTTPRRYILWARSGGLQQSGGQKVGSRSDYVLRPVAGLNRSDMVLSPAAKR